MAQDLPADHGVLLDELPLLVVSGPGLRKIASGTATLPMSCSRKPNSICGRPPLPADARTDRQPVGGDPLRVHPGVGVARLDRVGSASTVAK